MNWIRILGFTVALSLPAINWGHAASSDPAEIVKANVAEVVAAIKQSKDRRSLLEIADKKVAPNFDFEDMTRTAVGKMWREATPDQQRRLERAFRGVLVQTYTSALSTSNLADVVVDVRPVSVKSGQDEVTVKSVAKQAGKQPVNIDYRLAHSANGWKVVDVMVENLSLVTNYRGSFATEISRGGIDGLIQTLEAKNKSLAGA